MSRILFLTTTHEDYLADSLLHGLRTLLGPDVVDFPKAEFLYDSYPVARRGDLYGHGFSLYGLLDDVPVDRDGALERALDGEFDLIVFADIWNTFGRFAELAPSLSGVRMAVLDGADNQQAYPYAVHWWRKPTWWMLPRAHTRAIYFKRELTPITGWFRSTCCLHPSSPADFRRSRGCARSRFDPGREGVGRATRQEAATARQPRGRP